MKSKLFDILIRKSGHTSPLQTHNRRLSRVISAVHQLLDSSSISGRLEVESLLDAEGREWLSFLLIAGEQFDLFRPEQAGSDPVDQEAADVKGAVLSKVAVLREMMDEVRLTPSKFWEILHCHGFDTGELDAIKVARTLQVKRLHLVDTEGGEQSLLIDGLLFGMARAEPVDLNIAVKLVSSNHAICQVLKTMQPIEAPTKRKVRLVWGSFQGVEAISKRLLAANRDRRPLKVRAHPVIGINGEVHSFELVEFLPTASKRSLRTSRRPSLKGWFSGADWPMPALREFD